ncbi:hypothetical protein GCM10010912_26710 [Paenibacillus albidus]|uniref:Flagellar hook-length control protein-like C-terminal domain-containing protein n=1 Tax=Paenibacillus albidus TaxID=2041023 RepID=A0A917CBL0_9BACL|nr:flagellar hook-length control protein FliK [Paenibacillus albidus]GGF80295.1 hypothetical protein GCM10010912_26710 [Paenibacillus albidus]
MSLIVQTLSNANALPTTGATGTTTGAVTGIPFAQTLVQIMGADTGKAAAAPLMGNLASLLQGLLSQVQTASEGEEGKEASKADLLKDLTQDIELLDDKISSDPVMLEALQSWLLEVSSLLLTSGGQATEGLSFIAQNPETIRFAVQDELNSLVTLVQKAASEGNEELTAKGIAVLNNFPAFLEQKPAVAESRNKAKNANGTDSTNMSVVQVTSSEENVEEKPKMVNSLNVRTDLAASKNELAVSANASTEKALTDTEVTAPLSNKTAATVEMVKGTAVQDEVTPQIGSGSDEQEVVTAGQLIMREGITAPLKAEVRQVPVPVQQFANEMNSFITGKLEIVKKGGVAEAIITLFPENLGQVDVKITMQNGHLVAQFLTEHAGAKDLLEQQMNQLRAALQSQGLQVEKLEVTQNNTPLQSQFGQEGRQPGAGGQKQDRRSKERGEEASEAVLTAELSGEWKEWVTNAQQEASNQGGSFSARA